MVGLSDMSIYVFAEDPVDPDTKVLGTEGVDHIVFPMPKNITDQLQPVIEITHYRTQKGQIYKSNTWENTLIQIIATLDNTTLANTLTDVFNAKRFMGARQLSAEITSPEWLVVRFEDSLYWPWSDEDQARQEVCRGVLIRYNLDFEVGTDFVDIDFRFEKVWN